jgi:hypothetical protein
MSAAESTIATLQHQLHQESQRRFEQIEKNQDRQQKMLEQIVASTAGLPDLKNTIAEMGGKVESLEGAHNRLKGGTGVLGAIVGSWEIVRFILFKH